MKEWDVASVKRKFEMSYAYCSIGGNSPVWQWIGKISDIGLMKIKGQEVLADTTIQDFGDPPPYPRIEFFYRPINLGWCYSKAGPALLLKTHMKSYKVGISMETHYIPELEENFAQLGLNPDLGPQATDKFTIFNRFLWRNKNTLLFMQDEIGFMEGTKCFLNKPSFTKLVKESLGDMWQIIS